MRAVLVENPGDESRLVLGEFDTPHPAENELLVRVHATALNRADLLQRSGKYPVPKGASPLLGLEMAGVVEEVGSGCSGWSVGDRVFGLLPGGGYAEFATIPQEMAMPIPDSYSFEEAAAIPEVFLTAYQALVWLGELKEGEDILIHAGASGVGTAAIQLAKEIGARIWVTASKPKHKLCITLGAQGAIDYKSEDFVERINTLTQEKGVNLIIDFLGASYLSKNIECLGLDGRLVMLALMGGARVDSLNLATLFRKRIHLKASTLRNRSLSYKVALTKAFNDDFGTSLGKGLIKPIIDSIYDWSEVAKAHNRMAANLNAGKIVLKVT